jgi:hypothetical protein
MTTTTNLDIGEHADRVVEAVRDFVKRSLAAYDVKRAKQDAELAALIRELVAELHKKGSVPQRVGRHAEHLARLETRLAALERSNDRT